MILDLLENSALYESLHPGFAAAFAHLRTMATTPTLGRHSIDGDRLLVIIERSAGRGIDQATLEVHRRYIDIQVHLNVIGHANVDEVIGWRPLTRCTAPIESFNTDRDIQFHADRPSTWLRVSPGEFVVFYPTDAHAPLAGESEVLKAIYKVAVNWD